VAFLVAARHSFLRYLKAGLLIVRRVHWQQATPCRQKKKKDDEEEEEELCKLLLKHGVFEAVMFQLRLR